MSDVLSVVLDECSDVMCKTVELSHEYRPDNKESGLKIDNHFIRSLVFERLVNASSQTMSGYITMNQ